MGGAEERGLEGQELGHEVCLLTQGQAALKFLIGLRSWFGLVCRKDVSGMAGLFSGCEANRPTLRWSQNVVHTVNSDRTP